MSDAESQWIKDCENACRCCGGSGHKDDASTYIEELEAKLARLREAQGWRPIETAPRDGTRIMAYEPSADSKNHEIWWEDDCGGPFQGWTDDWDTEPEPTHWMPLPEPPQETDK